jgi:chorismate mutase/prephenate dehydratase
MFTPILACCQQPFTLIISLMTDALIPLREQIDTIDEQLIRLIKQRIAVVEKVGEVKKVTAPNLCPIRAGREAIRSIAERFKGSSFSAATAAAIWRLIIGASTHAESKLVISVLYNEKEHDYFWMAREYFGPSVTIIKQPNVKRIISDVLEGKSTIGLLPNFSASDKDEWWAALVQRIRLKFLRICPLFLPMKRQKECPQHLRLQN